MIRNWRNTSVKFAWGNIDIKEAWLDIWWCMPGDAFPVVCVIISSHGYFLLRCIWKMFIPFCNAGGVMRHSDWMKAARTVARTCEHIFWIRNIIQVRTSGYWNSLNCYVLTFILLVFGLLLAGFLIGSHKIKVNYTTGFAGCGGFFCVVWKLE